MRIMERGDHVRRVGKRPSLEEGIVISLRRKFGSLGANVVFGNEPPVWVPCTLLEIVNDDEPNQ
jgi:hypothetical protein